MKINTSLVQGPKRFFGGEREENQIGNNGRCRSLTKGESCGSNNVYKVVRRRTNSHILYDIKCNDCGFVQKLAMNRYKDSNFLKILEIEL